MLAKIGHFLKSAPLFLNIPISRMNSWPISTGQVVYEGKYSRSMNINPILPGHFIAQVFTRESNSISDLSSEEIGDLFETILHSMNNMVRCDATAFNIFSIDGISSQGFNGSSCWHIVPRKPLDLPSSDLVYSLLERWVADESAIFAREVNRIDLVPENQRFARTFDSMAKEATWYRNSCSQSELASLSSLQEVRFSTFALDSRQVFHVSPSGLSLAIVNLKPLVPGHVLVISRRVVARYSDLSPEERADLWQTVCKVQRIVLPCYCASQSRIGLQDGPDSGQTVPHVHVHILPQQTLLIPNSRL